MENRLLKVSAFPHVKAKDSVKTIMLDVIIALLPAMLMGIRFYGIDATVIYASTIGAALLSELLWNKAVKGQFRLEDFSGAITAILISLIMPSYVAPWVPAVATVFVIIILKQCFGGLGGNFINPAATAKVFIIASWTSQLIQPATDGVTSASASAYTPSLKEIFLGYASGNIGEASILALIIGGLYLLFRRRIDGKGTLAFLGSVALFSFVIGADGLFKGNIIDGLMVGNIFLVGIFMVNDFVTTPVTSVGKIIFGAGCGLLTVLFKVIGHNSDGAFYAIMLMNLFTPMIDSFTMPKAKKEAV